MAVFQTPQARGKTTPPAAYTSGVVVSTIVSHTFSAAFATANDTVEMAVLPAGARLLSVVAIFANIGAVNTSLGIMTGTPGSTDNARTVGTELFSAQTMANGEVSPTRAACLAVAANPSADRSIGIKPATDIAAGGTKTVTLIIEYCF
jgi:hypothetical protein